MMKRRYILLIVGILFLILVLIKILSNYKKEKSVIATPVAQALPADCIVAKDTIIDFSYKAVGNTRANESVELVSELSLRLVSIHFREGSFVNKGDVLFQLDDSEWKANQKKVQAKLDLAIETEKRNETLLKSGGISQQAFDQSVSDRKVLEAEDDYLNVMIGKAQIRAPFSGIIGIREVSEGALLTPGRKLTTLEDLSRLKIDFTIPEAYASMIHIGERINFRLDGIPGTFNAVIEALNPSINKNSGNLGVLAIVENPDPALKAGVSVSLTLVSKSSVPAIYIPTQSLIPTPGGYHIYVCKDSKADYRPVTTGLRTDKLVEIVKGVTGGDSVLVTGFMTIRPNSRVKINKVW